MDGWKSQKSDSRDARELDAPTDIDRSNRRCVTRRLDPRVDLKKKIYSRCDGKISFSTDVIGSWSGRSMGRVVIRNLKVKRVGRRVPRPSSSHRIATHLTHLIHPRQCATSCACRSGRSAGENDDERNDDAVSIERVRMETVARVVAGGITRSLSDANGGGAARGGADVGNQVRIRTTTRRSRCSDANARGILSINFFLV